MDGFQLTDLITDPQRGGITTLDDTAFTRDKVEITNAFSREINTGLAIYNLATTPTYELDKNFSAIDRARGTPEEAFLNLTVHARNEQEYEDILRKAIKKNRDMQIMAAQPLSTSLMLGFGVSVADPSTLLFMGLSVPRNIAVSSKIAISSGLGVSVPLLQEVLLQAVEPDRSKLGSVINVGSGLLLGGLFGTLGVRGSDFSRPQRPTGRPQAASPDDLTARLDDDSFLGPGSTATDDTQSPGVTVQHSGPIDDDLSQADLDARSAGLPDESGPAPGNVEGETPIRFDQEGPELDAAIADPLTQEFMEFSRITANAEKIGDPDDWTPLQRQLWAEGDWEAFSRSRGYTEAEISDFRKFLDLSGQVERKYGTEFAAGMAHEAESSVTPRVPIKRFTQVFGTEDIKTQKTRLIDTIFNISEEVLPAAAATRLAKIVGILPDELFVGLTITTEGLRKGLVGELDPINNILKLGLMKNAFKGTTSASGPNAKTLQDTGDIFSHEMGHEALFKFVDDLEFKIARELYESVADSRKPFPPGREAQDFHEWFAEAVSESIARNVDGLSRRTDFREDLFPNDRGAFYRIVRNVLERISTFFRRFSNEVEPDVPYEELIDNFVGNLMDSIANTNRVKSGAPEVRRIFEMANQIPGEPGIFNAADNRLKFAQAFDDLAGRRAPPGGGGNGVPPPGAGGSAGGAASSGGDSSIFPTGTGFETRFAETQPVLRLMAAPAQMARIIAEKLIDTPMLLKKNFYKVTTEQSVETLTKIWRNSIIESLNVVGENYYAYHRGFAGNADKSNLAILAGQATDALLKKVRGSIDDPNKPMSLFEFRDNVSFAARRGDVSDIPEVQAAAKAVREIRDRIDDDARAVGLLDENLDSGPTKSHLPRIWLQEIVRARRVELANKIEAWQAENIGLLPEKLQKQIAAGNHRAVLNAQIEKLTSLNNGVDGSARNTVEAGKKGVFQERSIFVPDEIIEEFLENDIANIMRQWIPQVAADVEIARKFKTLDMAEAFKALNKEYDDLIAAAPDAAGRAFLEKKRTENIRDITAMRDIQRGTYNIPDNPYAPTSIAARLSLEFNNLSMLGMVTPTSLPDAFRIVMKNGMATIPVVNLAFRDFKKFKLTLQEAKLAGVGLDMSLQTMAMALFHTGDLPNRFTGLEKKVGYLSNAWFIINMLSPWNAAIKQAAGTVTMHRLVQDMGKMSRGTLGVKKAAQLRSLGIGEDNIGGILAQVEKHGENVHGVNIVNSHLWDDSVSQLTFRAALAKEVDAQIVTPGVGDIPLFAHKTPKSDEFSSAIDDVFGSESKVGENVKAAYPELGKLFFQYKSFQFGSVTRTAISGLQMRDAASLSGLMGMVTMGGLVSMFKDTVNGRPTPDSVTEFLFDGFDQSGAWGWIGSVNSAAEALSNNGIGARAFLGIADPFGSSLKWKVGSVVGPTGSQLFRGGEIGLEVVTGNADWRTLQSAGKVVPGQNHFLTKIFNLAQTREWFETAGLNTGIEGAR
jgi:hypothetical protein